MRSYTATRRDLAMLEAVARYHGFSKSATITSLVKREFWRVFPAGIEDVRPDDGARVAASGVSPGGGAATSGSGRGGPALKSRARRATR